MIMMTMTMMIMMMIIIFIHIFTNTAEIVKNTIRSKSLSDKTRAFVFI